MFFGEETALYSLDYENNKNVYGYTDALSTWESSLADLEQIINQLQRVLYDDEIVIIQLQKTHPDIELKIAAFISAVASFDRSPPIYLDSKES